MNGYAILCIVGAVLGLALSALSAARNRRVQSGLSLFAAVLFIVMAVIIISYDLFNIKEQEAQAEPEYKLELVGTTPEGYNVYRVEYKKGKYYSGFVAVPAK